jgi:hypothetical protein
MTPDRRTFLAASAALVASPAMARSKAAPIRVTSPMAAPRWAVLQRELLAENSRACADYYAKYVSADHELLCFPRWGANDGPDDAGEFTNDFIQLHALGGDDRLLDLVLRFWEGHIRQYTRVRTIETPAGRNGMFVRDFNAQQDWQHHSEELTTFNVMGLSAPRDLRLIQRTRRFADMYSGRDPLARNYDAKRRVMRSMVNGSIGPLMRPATALDWVGDPFDVRPFHLLHGETSYAQFLEHYQDYNDVVCDNPLNLNATMLGLNAYALGGGEHYRRWVLDYLDAWIERAKANNDILPSKVGADGKAAADWWGSVYGWGFSPIVPQTGKREDRNRLPRSIMSFYNGLLLTGDKSYIDLWRRQNLRINSLAKPIDGVLSTPSMHGADGWYSWKPGPYRQNGIEIWYATQDPQDRALAADNPWLDFLEGRNPSFPEQALTKDLARVRSRDEARKLDTTTPGTRLADWPMDFNPASATALIQTMTGGLHTTHAGWSPSSPRQGGVVLHCRLRYFDPANRRAGLPPEVGALVHSLGDRQTEVTLVNLGQKPREIIVQGGAFGEHRIDAVTLDGKTTPVTARHFSLRLEPGCGARLQLAMTRYVNQPSLAFPWA